MCIGAPSSHTSKGKCVCARLSAYHATDLCRRQHLRPARSCADLALASVDPALPTAALRGRPRCSLLREPPARSPRQPRCPRDCQGAHRRRGRLLQAPSNFDMLWDLRDKGFQLGQDLRRSPIVPVDRVPDPSVGHLPGRVGGLLGMHMFLLMAATAPPLLVVLAVVVLIGSVLALALGRHG